MSARQQSGYGGGSDSSSSVGGRWQGASPAEAAEHFRRRVFVTASAMLCVGGVWMWNGATRAAAPPPPPPAGGAALMARPSAPAAIPFPGSGGSSSGGGGGFFPGFGGFPSGPLPPRERERVVQEMSERIGIDGKTAGRLLALRETSAARMRQINGNPLLTLDQKAEQMERVRASRREATAALLTPEQMTRYQEWREWVRRRQEEMQNL